MVMFGGPVMSGQLLNVTPGRSPEADVFEASRMPPTFRVLEERTVQRAPASGFLGKAARAGVRAGLKLVGLGATFVLSIVRFVLGLAMVLSGAAAVLLLLATLVTGEKNGYNWVAVSAAIAFGSFVAMYVASLVQLWAQSATGLRRTA